MPRKGRRRRRKLVPPPEHEGKLHNKPHEAKGRPMLPFTFVRQTRACEVAPACQNSTQLQQRI